MSAFDQFTRMVQNMMSRFGGEARVLIRAENGTYDASSSEYVVTEQSYIVKAAVFDFTLKNSGIQSEPNSLIQAGDKQVFVQPISDGLPLPKIKPNRDAIKLGNEVWKITTLKEINPSYNDPILLELYVRK